MTHSFSFPLFREIEMRLFLAVYLRADYLKGQIYLNNTGLTIYFYYFALSKAPNIKQRE